ncbi:hypothetical protein CSHISOI_09206 [Colletotrichum shisoi]|uniref:Uncharacterized protein n=1 Tax=Colletotrichum shisoi TaxID=2078593 RepID=A0A5Q4BHH4_9PEZI|nr:hypothetical protein CSHISOI_09206 [Colletotrichum shisoi]
MQKSKAQDSNGTVSLQLALDTLIFTFNSNTAFEVSPRQPTRAPLLSGPKIYRKQGHSSPKPKIQSPAPGPFWPARGVEGRTIQDTRCMYSVHFVLVRSLPRYVWASRSQEGWLAGWELENATPALCSKRGRPLGGGGLAHPGTAR